MDALGGKTLGELWDAIKHEKVKQQKQSRRFSGRLFEELDLPPVVPASGIGLDEMFISNDDVVIGEKDDHDGEDIVSQGKVPKMNRWLHEFVDRSLEQEYRSFFDPEHRQRSTSMSLLFFILGIFFLALHYIANDGFEEIAITHAIHLLILLSWVVFKHKPEINHDAFLLTAETIAFILTPLRTYYVVSSTEKTCWEKATTTNTTLMKYEALECVVSAQLGFNACGVYVFALLIACLSLRKFKLFVFASIVINSVFGYVYLSLLSFPSMTVVPTFVLVSGIFLKANRAMDKFMRRDFLWYVDTLNLLRFHMNGVEKGKQHRERIVAYLFHEVRNPINNISLAVQAATTLSQELSESNNNNAPPTAEVLEDLQQLTEVVSNAAQAATHVLNDALDLEKLAAGSFTFVPVAFKFDELCSGVVRSIQARFAVKHIDVMVNIDPELKNFTVLGDLHRLQQVLQNFLSNAAKFTPKGGEVRLDIQTLHDSTPILPRPQSTKIFLPARVAVSDTGPGLTSEEQKLLFKPFSQIRAGELQGGGGTGLGLSLSKDFVQRGHNGRIGVKSPGLLNTGSTFFFDINYPVVPAVPPPKTSVQSSTPRSSFARRLSLLTPRVFDQPKSQQEALPKPSRRSVSVSGVFRKQHNADWSPARRRQSLESQITPHVAEATLQNGGATARALFGSAITTNRYRASLCQSSMIFADDDVDPAVFSHPEDTVAENSVQLDRRNRGDRPSRNSFDVDSNTTQDLLSEPEVSGEPVAQLSKEQEKSNGSERKKKRVLVVEDSSITRKLMTRALVKLGVEVETAENGQVACDVMDTSPLGHLSLLFMDKEMPVLDGMEATRILRAAGHTVPIIAVTGNVQQQQQEEFLLVGATEVLAKPVNVTELVGVLKRHNLID